jgi:hypothetical protein
MSTTTKGDGRASSPPGPPTAAQLPTSLAPWHAPLTSH